MSEETAVALPYVHHLNGRDPVEILAETPAKLGELFEGLSPEQIEHKSAPHKWNLREILAHLADCEIAWSWRLRQMYSEPHATLQPFDQDAWGRAYASYTFAAARETHRALRAWNVALLSRSRPEDWQRMAIHPELGGVTLRTVVEIAAGHDLHHLDSLTRVVHALKTA